MNTLLSISLFPQTLGLNEMALCSEVLAALQSEQSLSVRGGPSCRHMLDNEL